MHVLLDADIGCRRLLSRQTQYAWHLASLEFEAGVVDGQADVAGGLGQPGHGVHLVGIGLEHDHGDGDGFSGRLDGADGGVAVDIADLHEDADAALDQLGVLHVDVDHEVVVDVAQAGHGAGGDHVADHLLGGGGLHAGRSGDDLGADLGDDGGVRNLRERSASVAGDGRGHGAAGARILDCADDVGGASGGGDADDNVLAGGPAAGDVALADFGRILVDVGGGCEGLGSAGHDVLDLLGQGGVGGRTLGRVERGDAPRGAGADVDETATIAQGAGDDIDDDGDLRQRLLDGGCDPGVFVVDDACDLEGGFGIEALGCDVGGFGGRVVGCLGMLRGSFGRDRLFEHSDCGHRVPPPLFDAIPYSDVASVLVGCWATNLQLYRQWPLSLSIHSIVSQWNLGV